MDRLQQEGQSQLRRYRNLTENGCTLLEDHHGLENLIGHFVKMRVVVDGFTPKGLVKVFIEGEPNEKAFHLLIPHRVIKYNPDISFNDLTQGSVLSLGFVIGVRMVGEESFVISLRLPQ